MTLKGEGCLPIRAMILLPLCLVACGRSDGNDLARKARSEAHPAIAVDIEGAAKAEDLDDTALFDFEQMQPTGHPAPSATGMSNLAMMLGSSAQRFPGNTSLGPFKLGMTSQEVEKIAREKSLSIGLMSTSDGSAVDCTSDTTPPNGRTAFHAIPSSYEIRLRSGERYTLGFIDDAGWARVSEIEFAPDTEHYRRAQWQASLLRMFGKPTFKGQDADDRTWQWCSTGERDCSGDRTSSRPSLTAREYANQDGAFLTLSVGKNVTDAANLIADQDAAPAKALEAVTCQRSMTPGETRLLERYLASLGEMFAPEAPTMFRLSVLPKGLQSVLLFRLGTPTWLKAVGRDFVAKYDVAYSRDPASYSETRYVAFAQTAGQAYEAVWQGDAKALQARYPAQSSSKTPS